MQLITSEEQDEKLTQFIMKREGINYHDAQDFAYEILEFIGSREF